MIAQLTPAQLARGVITYSSGNHAQGVAYAARALGAKAVIVMPDNAPQVKIDATRALGAEVVFVGPASSARKLKAEELAAAHGYTIIPPYDHPHIIAGQATCGLEIVQQLPDVDLILSPVSGGGLLSGTATAVKLAGTDGRVQVWGAEPALAADAKESFDTRTLVEWPAAMTSRTLGDGLRTQSLGDAQLPPHPPLRRRHRHRHRRRDPRRHALPARAHRPRPRALRRRHPRRRPLPRHELPPAKQPVVILSGGNVDPALLARSKPKSPLAGVQ